MLLQVIDKINEFLWGIPSILLLAGTGLFLTFVIKGLQFRKLGEAFKLAFTKDAEDIKSGQGDVSNFKALMTSLAGMIGNGNIAGVATGVTLGGPGAIFWMWLEIGRAHVCTPVTWPCRVPSSACEQ